MSVYGSRFSGGYQFGRTASITGRREKPIRVDGPLGPDGAMLELVPITGGRPETFDVVSRATTIRDGHPHETAASNIVVGRQAADREYVATLKHLRAGREPGTPRA